MIFHFSFQNVTIDNTHIAKKPQQITPPLARFAAHSIIISLLVVQVNTSHVLVVRNGGRDGENVVSCSLFHHQLDSIECSENKLILCLSILTYILCNEISIDPFVRLSLRLFEVTNHLESLSDWMQITGKLIDVTNCHRICGDAFQQTVE